MGEAAASAHFLLKICFKVSPARLPQGTPQFLCRERKKERERLGAGLGNGEEEAWGRPGREAQRERGTEIHECSVDPADGFGRGKE